MCFNSLFHTGYAAAWLTSGCPLESIRSQPTNSFFRVRRLENIPHLKDTPSVLSFTFHSAVSEAAATTRPRQNKFRDRHAHGLLRRRYRFAAVHTRAAKEAEAVWEAPSSVFKHTAHSK